MQEINEKTSFAKMLMEKKPTYEEAAGMLEDIVQKLNSGSVHLDEMIVLFERGAALSDYCMKLLSEYEGRIEIASGAGSAGN